MYGYNTPFFDLLRWRDQEAQNDPNAMTPSFKTYNDMGSPAGDQGGIMGGAIQPFQPSTWSSGSPAGDQGGLMGGGDSLAKTGGWTKDQMSGASMAMKGLGSAVNAFTGADAKPIQAPRIDDNSGAIRQQAAQMWQQVMQKKPRGLI